MYAVLGCELGLDSWSHGEDWRVEIAVEDFL